MPTTLRRFLGVVALAPLVGMALGQTPPGLITPPGRATVGPAAPPPLYNQNAYSPIAGPGYAGPRGPAPMIAPPAPPAGATGGGPVAMPVDEGYQMRFGANSAFGNGLGWDDGYSSVGAWVPLGINDETSVLYLDARGYFAHTDGLGGNFTAGYRYLIPEYERYFGVYGGYDLDGGNFNTEYFHQLVIGGESVGRYLTYRMNGYIPIGDVEKEIFSGISNPVFRGHNIFFLDVNQTRYQYGGVDGEVGGPLPLIGKYGLSGYAGGYFLGSNEDSTIGFKGRFEANVNDDLQVGVKMTTDEIFETNIWATVTLRTPRGSWWEAFRKDWLRQPTAATQMDRSPVRNYRIATDLKTTSEELLAIRPLDGRPYVVLHVDPQGDGGNGTFENPAAAIRGNNRSRYDIVYVGEGTLDGFGPIQLFDDQRLLSTAVSHVIPTQRGLLPLAGQINSPLPLLRNSSFTPSSVIQLADNNEVSGFAIDGVGPFGGRLHAGIIGDEITSFDINRNRFDRTTEGVLITHVGNGTGALSGNRFIGPAGRFGSTDAFRVDVIEDSILDIEVNNNLVRQANGTGIVLTARENATLTADISGNRLTRNEDGMRIQRTGNPSIDNVRITNNQFVGNFANGLNFQIAGGLLDDTDVVAANNTFSNNGANGIFGLVEADGILDLTLRNNLFAGNQSDGIRLTQNRFAIDQGGVRGTWTNNNFVRNDIHGIDISAPMLGLQVGTAEAGNLIANNGLIGLYLPGPGEATFTNNMIAANGADQPDVTSGTGIDIEHLGFKDFRFVNNRVVNNFGDGIEIENGRDVINNDHGTIIEGNVSVLSDLEFVNNIVARNDGRGYDVLNKGNSFLDLTIRGTAPGRSVIAENGREGIYVVNTASFSQTQQGPTPVVANPSQDPTHGMSNNGDYQFGSHMRLTVTGNQIVGNGIDQTSTVGLPSDAVGGSGLVIRVGTGDGGYGDTFPGGFATPPISFPPLDGLPANAGVIAVVNNNFFSGNFGADVYTESFTSTEDPPDTNGTWDEDEFEFNGLGYEGDPLARMHLTFNGNTLEEANFFNLGAFYNNAEAEFKSRVFNTDTNNNPPNANGPFQSGTRRRNAQRVAFRGDLPPFGVPNARSDLFLYAGMGESTFRISQSTFSGTNQIIQPGGATTPITGVNLFFPLDDQPYNDVSDANGVFLINSLFGEQPYGWSIGP